MTSTAAYVLEVAKSFKDQSISLVRSQADKSFYLDYPWYTQPKQRPRNNTHYTPKETREFEKDVRANAIGEMNGRPIMLRPLVAHITIYDKVEKGCDIDQFLVEHNLLHIMDRGDVDNCVKSIFDALNGVVYRDDKQVIQLFAVRRCHYTRAGFTIEIRETGFSKGMVGMLYKALGRAKDGNER